MIKYFVKCLGEDSFVLWNQNIEFPAFEVIGWSVKSYQRFQR